MENEGGQGSNNSNAIPDDDSWHSDPVKVKEYVGKLRTENKARRQAEAEMKTQFSKLQNDHNTLNEKIKKAFGDGSNDPPEKQIENLTMSNKTKDEEIAALKAQMGFADFAAESGITDPKERRYLQFLINDHMSDKPENYEMSDDELAGIVKQVTDTRGAAGGKGGGSSTSFGGSTPKPEGSGGASGSVTLEQFIKMGTGDRTLLYGRDPDLYNKLQKQSVAARH